MKCEIQVLLKLFIN